MKSQENIRPKWAHLVSASRPYARHGSALIAGVGITLMITLGTMSSVAWFTFAVIFSLLLKDGPRDALNLISWWAGCIVAGATTLGVILGRMSPSSAISLVIAMAAFETARSFARKDKLWGWTSGTLAVILTFVYTFVSDRDSIVFSGVLGIWAILSGVFGLIGVIDEHRKQKGKSGVPGLSKVNEKLGLRKGK